MSTYIQNFLLREVKSMREVLLETRRFKRQQLQSDISVIRAICGLAAKALFGARLSGVDFPAGIFGKAVNAMVVCNSMAPFFRIGTDRPGSIFAHDAHALQPSAYLVDDLSAFNPTKSDLAAVARSLRAAAWYIDVPRGVVHLGEHQELRAIFSSPFNPGDYPDVSAITTEVGTNKLMTAISWGIGKPGYLGAFSAGIDSALFKNLVEHLLVRLIAHKLNYAEKAGTPLEILAHMPIEQMAANPRRESQNLKKFSLFRVVRLGSSSKRPVGHRNSGQRRGWKLQNHHTVTGHKKLQAYGPKRSLRREIWIDGYERGPLDGLIQAELTILPPQTFNH